MNLRPSGYEPDELPGCSTPRLSGHLDPWRIGKGDWKREGNAGLAATYSSAPWGAVPSALRVFTAEFGMGSGVWPLAMATRPASLVRAQPAPGREQAAGISLSCEEEESVWEAVSGLPLA